MILIIWICFVLRISSFEFVMLGVLYPSTSSRPRAQSRDVSAVVHGCSAIIYVILRLIAPNALRHALRAFSLTILGSFFSQTAKLVSLLVFSEGI